jgi:hypothetical protein
MKKRRVPGIQSWQEAGGTSGDNEKIGLQDDAQQNP